MKLIGPALLLLMGTISAPIHLVESNGEDAVFVIPAHDITQGPESLCQSHVVLDIEYTYTVTNNTGAVQQVILCQPGSRQGVELWSEDGAGIGSVSFPLMPVSLTVQPGATDGPSTVTVLNVPAGWQSLLGNVPGLEGMPGAQVKILAQFPRTLVTTNNGCRVQQSVHVRAHIRIDLS